MEYSIHNDVEKTFIAIGRNRMKFHSMLEELIDNSLKWEEKQNAVINIKISEDPDHSDYYIIEYKDDSNGIPKEDIPTAIAVGCQLQTTNLHAHGYGFSCFIAVLQETYNIKDWILKTGNVIVYGPIIDKVNIVDDPNGNNGLYMKFRFPKGNLRYLPSHGNSKTMERKIIGLAARYGFRYRKYLQSKLLTLSLTHSGGSKNVVAVIPEFTQYGAYPINMPDGRCHNVEFGLFEGLNKEDEIPDLYVGKSNQKGYFTIFNGKVLGMINLLSIFDSKDYNAGKVFNFKEWYAVITLDSRTSGNITNAIKDGLNEQHPEVQYIINKIREHIDQYGYNDIRVFLNQNPTEGATKKKILRIFKATHEKDGWRVLDEFKPIKHSGLNPISIDLVRYHPELKIVYFYELKKNQFDVKAITQFYGYKVVIEDALENPTRDCVNPELREMIDYDIRYISLSDNAELTPPAWLLLESCPVLSFFEIEDYRQYAPRPR